MTQEIESLLEELAQNIPFYDRQKPGVSKSGIGWHIEHSLLTIDRVAERLLQTDSRNYKWKFSFPRLLVFTTQMIPRARAQSPASVQPGEHITQETLAAHLKSATEKLKQLAQAKKDQYFEHPFFGHVKLKQAVKFLAIHTKHHLKIIRDIKR